MTMSNHRHTLDINSQYQTTGGADDYSKEPSCFMSSLTYKRRVFFLSSTPFEFLHPVKFTG